MIEERDREVPREYSYALPSDYPTTEEYKPVPVEMSLESITPLINRAPGQDGLHQVLDRYTLEKMWDRWYDEKGPKFYHVKQLDPDYEPPPWSDDIVPEVEMFVDSERYESIHGAGHIGEGVLLVRWLGKYLKVPKERMGMERMGVLEMGMFLTDIRKDMDGETRDGHGKDAADWFVSDDPRATKLREPFSEEEIAIIQRLATYHDAHWADIKDKLPLDEVPMHIAVRAADALARGRIQYDIDQADPDRIPIEDKEFLNKAIDFARGFVISWRIFRLRSGLSIRDALKQKGIDAGLVAPDKPVANVVFDEKELTGAR